ncbi:MAG: Rnf-Nqr domain containing protein, partial [Oscillospiraceae bacterium]
LLNIDNGYTLVESMFNSLGAGLGFGLALVIFSGVRQRVDASNCPKAFKGIPITLVAASIVSLAFVGFNGVIEGIFQ